MQCPKAILLGESRILREAILEGNFKMQILKKMLNKAILKGNFEKGVLKGHFDGGIALPEMGESGEAPDTLRVL